MYVEEPSKGLEQHRRKNDRYVSLRPGMASVGFKYFLSTDEVLFTQRLRKLKRYRECSGGVLGGF
ncbi:hypothetical protein BC792_101169 [Sphingobacterium allocomposti]|uniref:Uncharacterized protein n=1 Tax=Sphingobacterium allocomposti TaxID=415956 RepID=A0A5S5DUL8_9SPHI|nr:hypothetical protein BC792_101169 [Sphingobacterium composti Yoo et al. 2007 non Ten et al. 2007]